MSGANAHAAAGLWAGRGFSRIVFEPNHGQVSRQIDFLAHGPGYNIFLTPGEAVFALQAWETTAKRGASLPSSASSPQAAVLRMTVVGADRQGRAAGETTAGGHVNYLVGRDPRAWHVNIPLYSSVRYRRVYPGIDLLYHGSQRQLEYDFVASPHTRPQAIRLRFEGQSGVAVAPDGSLALRMGNQQMRWHRPACYQTIRGKKRAVVGGYVLGKDGLVRFRLGAYDLTKPLVIDPVLAYQTVGVKIPVSLIAAPGSITIVVDNSWRGGGPSNPVTLIVDPAP